MIIAGKWHLFPDGITRPVVSGAVGPVNGPLVDTQFLVDSGADRTVLSRQTLDGLPASAQTGSGAAVAGVAGQAGCVVVQTILHFTREDGTTVRVHGAFPAFLALDASDIDILGREVLNNFEVILSYPRQEVLLLAPNHSYQIVTA
jgi:hypothetical protein